jgi:hypothetical protein
MGSSLFPARLIIAEGPGVVTPLVEEALASLSSIDKVQKGDLR